MEDKQLVAKPKGIEELEAEILALENGGASKELETPQEETKEVVEEVVLTKEEETFKKRYGDLRRHTEKLKKEYEEKLQKAQQGGAATIQPKTTEEVREWMEANPDVAGIVVRIAQEQFGTEDISNRLRAIEEREENLKQEEARRKLKELHPDFDEITSENSGLHNWAKDLPEAMQDILYGGDDVQTLSKILSLYKIEAGIKTPQAKTREVASAVPSRSKLAPSEGTKGRTYAESEIAKMSMEEYEANEKDILLAQREGRIVLDIRGAAY